jgi:hypothetical protein
MLNPDDMEDEDDSEEDHASVPLDEDAPLTNEEIESLEASINPRPYLQCFDIPNLIACCMDCHNAQDEALRGLSFTELIGRKKRIELLLCCAQLQFWHSQSFLEKIEIIESAEANRDRAEIPLLNRDLVRKILLAVEEFVESKDDWRMELHSLEISGHNREQVSDHICLLGEAGLLDVHLVKKSQNPRSAAPSGQYWAAKALTEQGWRCLDVIREESAWEILKLSTQGHGFLATKKNLTRFLDVAKRYVKP